MYLRHISNLLKNHKEALAFSLVVFVSLLVIGWYKEAIPKTITYMVTILVCFLSSEFIYCYGGIKTRKWEIKNPLGELKIVVLVQLIVILLLVYWFLLANPSELSRTVRISVLVIRLLFAYPIFLLIYFLAIKKYSLKELGFQFRYWYIAILIIILIGGTSFYGFPDGFQFQQVVQENGYLAFLTLGFLTAAIPEEITRHLFQSRLSKVLNNQSFGWIIASTIWALLHIPGFGRGGDYLGAAANALGIIPLGLLWGYLNERYKSIIPSILIHGTNLWGLQNIF